MGLSRSIGGKLVVACLLVELIALALLSWTNNLTMLDRLAQRFDSRLADEKRLFSVALAQPLIERDYGGLQDLLNTLIDPNTVSYLLMLDRSGRVMAAAGWPIARPPPPVSAGQPSEAVGRYDFTMPILIGNQAYGTLRGGISTTFFADAQRALIQRGVQVSLIAIGVSVALFASIGLWLTRRLHRVTSANDAFARGDMSTRVAVHHPGDEVDVLGAGFNAMADALERRLDELRERQRQLKMLADRLTLATSSGGVGVWEWEVVSQRLIWDARMFELYGLVPQHWVADYSIWRDACHPDDRARVEAELAAAIAGTAPFDTEFRIITPEGIERDIKAAGLVERDANGNPTAMVGINWDISATRKNERALETARRQAERANQAKSEFVANMSHEIRTPLNAILGLAYLLQQTHLTTLQSDYLEKTRISAQSLLSILNDILDFSKVEAGRLDLEAMPFELEKLLKTLAAITTTNARAKNIEVLFHIAPNTPLTLIGDPLRLQQVLLNLSSNAIKFTNHGEVVLSVQLAEGSESAAEGSKSAAEGGGQEPSVTLLFTVRDTGIGINAERRHHIFDAFAQADASTSRRYGGTGLGLTICQRLVTLMGGEITLDSEPGRGSAFSFTARFGVAPDQEDQPVPAMIRPTNDLRVLVVDDNPTACEIMPSMIAPFGWTAEIAASGRQALAAIDRSAAAAAPFDLILLDWRMPEISGQDVLIHARERYRPTEMPAILVVTAFEQDLVRREARDDTLVKAILTKPVTPSVLFDTVATVCPTLVAGLATAEVASTATAQPESLAGMTILLVEDNTINQLVARQVLEAVGALVEVADSGVQAIDILRATPRHFDVVLMDLQMPDMDGFEATRIIREHLGLTTLPVIAVTANALPADRERCAAAGMNGHIAKPIDVEVMFSTLAATLADSRARTDLPSATGDHPPRYNNENWPEISGIDVKAAANRLVGDHALFQTLLNRLASQFGDSADRIRAALDSGDRSEAHRLTHSLRGIAANLSAREVAALATSLELALAESRTSEDDILLAALEQAMTALLAAIAKQRPAAPDTAECSCNHHGECPPDAILALLGALERHNMDALELFNDLRHPFGHHYGMVMANRLGDAIEGLDFTEASAMLRSCLEAETA